LAHGVGHTTQTRGSAGGRVPTNLPVGSLKMGCTVNYYCDFIGWTFDAVIVMVVAREARGLSLRAGMPVMVVPRAGAG
jgi:hypothetical protein